MYCKPLQKTKYFSGFIMTLSGGVRDMQAQSWLYNTKKANSNG